MLSPARGRDHHPAAVDTLRISLKAASFTESVIGEFTRLADEHGAINLGQGFQTSPRPPR
jgi:hypothetical protein